MEDSTPPIGVIRSASIRVIPDANLFRWKPSWTRPLPIVRTYESPRRDVRWKGRPQGEQPSHVYARLTYQ
jgi:hypothetical protein